jgi:anti-sigma regulatory factor (Ser/Thr protein kinase)
MSPVPPDADTPGVAQLSLDLPAEPASAAAARRAVETLLRLEGEMLETVKLLVSELVTNSVRHAGLPASAEIGVKAAAADRLVRVEVTDSGCGFDPAERPEPSEKGGWGLRLVESLADRWGVERSRGVRVWFELDR